MKKIIALLALSFSTQAFADGSGGGLFRAQVGYLMEDTKTATSETKDTRQDIEAAAGYVWPMGFAVLGQYAMETDTSVSGGTTTTGNRTSYGPGIGYISRAPVGVYIDAFYYLSSKYAVGSSNYDGSGYQVDFGVKVDVSKIFIVAGVAYSAFDYNKLNGATTTYKQNHIGPRLGLQFEF